ncbi:hypothetical protein PanWU01x14_165020, partial [Parasponia andersonii]
FLCLNADWEKNVVLIKSLRTGDTRYKNRGIGKAWRIQVQLRIADDLLAKNVARQKLTIMKVTEMKSEMIPHINLHGKAQNISLFVNRDIRIAKKSIIAVEEADMAMAFDMKRMTCTVSFSLLDLTSKAA